MTLAHPAAVLPLRRLGLPMAGLVVGSTVPDVPLFLGWTHGYAVSHSVVGVLTVDLVLALVLLAAWDRLVRDALVDLSPDVVRDRLPARHRLGRRSWLLAPLAVVVGAATHLAWDAFTHPGRWGVTHVAWLGEQVGPLPGFKWAQYVSGVLGLVVVVGAVVVDLRARPVGDRSDPRVLPGPTLAASIGAAGAVALEAALIRVDDGLHAVAFDGVVAGILACCAAVALVCTAWLVSFQARQERR